MRPGLAAITCDAESVRGIHAVNQRPISEADLRLRSQLMYTVNPQ